MRVLVIPLIQTEHPRADNRRFNYLINELKRRDWVIGLEHIPYFGTNNQTIKYIKYLWYSLKTLLFGLRRRRNFDIVVADHVSFGITGAIISCLTGKPLVCDIAEGNVLTHSRVTNSSRLFTWLNMCLERFIGHVATVMAVPSEVDRQLYFDQRSQYKDKIIVLPSGVDLSAIPGLTASRASLREKLGLPQDKRLLIFMGKREYFPNKEAAFWINDELAPLLAREFDDVQILICGSGDVPSQVNPIVTFTGYVPDIYEYISACDICIVPYKLNTGISLKVLDAMACAKPVVILSSVASLFSYLVDGENIVIASDRKEFIKKVIWLLNSPDLLQEIGDNGRRLVEKHYNWETLRNEWRQAIEAALKVKLAKPGGSIG